MRAISHPVEAEKEDRKAGFLTKTEREYLLGVWEPNEDTAPGEWTERQARTKESDIATRTRHAIADIALLQQHGDDELIKKVIERGRNPDDIPTFYDETLENARKGLSEFLIRLAIDPEKAESLTDVLEGEDWGELMKQFAEDVEDSKEIAKQHGDILGPVIENLHNYAKANGISKTEMMDVIYTHWPDE